MIPDALRYPHFTGQKIGTIWIALAAAIAALAWLLVEATAPLVVHPLYPQMLAAARTVQAASAVLRAEKEARGLMQPATIDINKTGMIGSEYTGITTTLGDLGSKRTATNPDLAAYVVRLLAPMSLPRGAPVVLIVSGSFVGGNVSVIAAAESLGLTPIVVASLSASMWGANDPSFNWIDMMGALRAKGVIQAGIVAAVIGGEGATGGGMDRAGVVALRSSAERDHVLLVEARPISTMIDIILERVGAALPPGAKPGAIINVGGALIGLGTCRESYELPPGWVHMTSCSEGTPGVAFRLASSGVPMLNMINFRRLAVESGLPFDPSPLPTPGNNLAVYGLKRGSF